MKRQTFKDLLEFLTIKKSFLSDYRKNVTGIRAKSYMAGRRRELDGTIFVVKRFMELNQRKKK